MPIAHYIPFDPATDVLLRYGQIRQDFQQKYQDFLACQPVHCLHLADLFKPPALKEVQHQAPAWAASPLPMTQQQGRSPLLNQLMGELCCGTWLRTLETITGASHLLPDPYVTEGGLLHGAENPAAQLAHRLWRLPAALVLDVLLYDPQQQGARYRFEKHGMREEFTLRTGSALVWQWHAADDWPQRTAGSAALALRVLFWQGSVTGDAP